MNSDHEEREETTNEMNETGEEKGALSQAASELADSTKQAVASLASDLKQSAAHSASTVAQAAADGVKAKGHDASQVVKETVASTMYGTAERVRNRSKLPEAELIDKVAQRIESSGDYVREHDVTEMKDDLAYRVREAPLLAVALALFVGFLLGAILKRG